MEKERMVEPSMVEMSKAFHRAHRSLEDTVKSAQQIAQMMEEGALLGDAGDEFRNAIQSKLVPKVTTLGAKLMEMERDIKNAIARIHEAEGTAEKRFE